MADHWMRFPVWYDADTALATLGGESVVIPRGVVDVRVLLASVVLGASRRFDIGDTAPAVTDEDQIRALVRVADGTGQEWQCERTVQARWIFELTRLGRAARLEGDVRLLHRGVRCYVDGTYLFVGDGFKGVVFYPHFEVDIDLHTRVRPSGGDELLIVIPARFASVLARYEDDLVVRTHHLASMLLFPGFLFGEQFGAAAVWQRVLPNTTLSGSTALS